MGCRATGSRAHGMSGEVVPGSSGATDLAEPAAGGQGGEVWLDQGRGAQDDFRDALAGEARVAGHGVQDGGGELGGIGRLTRPFPVPHAIVGSGRCRGS